MYTIPRWLAAATLEAVQAEVQDPEAVNASHQTHELANKLEEVIDNKIRSGEAKRRSVVTETEVMSHVMIHHNEIQYNKDAKVDMTAIRHELAHRYKKHGGWKDFEIKKVDGGYEVTLKSALSDKHKQQLSDTTRRFSNKVTPVTEAQKGLKSVIRKYKAQLEEGK